MDTDGALLGRLSHRSRVTSRSPPNSLRACRGRTMRHPAFANNAATTSLGGVARTRPAITSPREEDDRSGSAAAVIPKTIPAAHNTANATKTNPASQPTRDECRRTTEPPSIRDPPLTFMAAAEHQSRVPSETTGTPISEPIGPHRMPGMCARRKRRPLPQDRSILLRIFTGDRVGLTPHSGPTRAPDICNGDGSTVAEGGCVTCGRFVTLPTRLADQVWSVARWE